MNTEPEIHRPPCRSAEPGTDPLRVEPWSSTGPGGFDVLSPLGRSGNRVRAGRRRVLAVLTARR